LGVHLGAALASNQVLVLEPSAGNIYADDECNANSWECSFQPLSSCTYQDAINQNAKTIGPKVRVYKNGSFRFTRVDCPNEWINRLQQAYPDHHFTPEFFKYWWRAQSAAYILRLNAPTSKILLELRLQKDLHQEWVAYTGNNASSRPFPFPLPPGTMNWHVRHGDKASGNIRSFENLFVGSSM